MKFKNIISLLVVCIAILSLFCSLVGIFSNQGNGEYEFRSVHGETVRIHGKGIYKYDSISVVAQGKAQDVITIILGIPLLMISLFLSRKGSLKGRLLLAGTLGYFLYTYMSYVFLWMYNPLFLLYVILMSASFFSFTLNMISFDLENLNSHFSKRLPVKFIGGFQIFFSISLVFLWLGRMVPALINKTVPFGLEHYTTLVIQGMDLGFIAPIAFISGIMILKRRPLGYLLSSVIIMKGITMGAAITAMIIGQALAGVYMSLAEIIMFPVVNLIIIYCLILLLKNINEGKNNSKNRGKLESV